MCFPNTISEIDWETSQLGEDELKIWLKDYCDKVINEIHELEDYWNRKYNDPRQWEFCNCIKDLIAFRKSLN